MTMKTIGRSILVPIILSILYTTFNAFMRLNKIEDQVYANELTTSSNTKKIENLSSVVTETNTNVKWLIRFLKKGD